MEYLWPIIKNKIHVVLFPISQKQCACVCEI